MLGKITATLNMVSYSLMLGLQMVLQRKWCGCNTVESPRLGAWLLTEAPPLGREGIRKTEGISAVTLLMTSCFKLLQLDKKHPRLKGL